MHTHENSRNGWYLFFVFLHVTHLLEHQIRWFRKTYFLQKGMSTILGNSEWKYLTVSLGLAFFFFFFHWKCHLTGAFSIRVHFLRLFSAATVWCSAAVWKHEKEDLYQRLQFFSCTNMTGCHVRSLLKSIKKALSCILYFLRSEKNSFQLSTYCFTLKSSCLLMLFVCHFVFKTKINIAFSICG